MQYEVKLTTGFAIKYIVGFLAFVGLFSYSLYLTHEIMLWQSAYLPFLATLLLCYVFAYVFFLIFENPFIAKKSAVIKN
jgi:peptidoglycan/LPS O-acetylase OafA/YrhL